MWCAAVPLPLLPQASIHKLLFGYFPAHSPNAPRPFIYRVLDERTMLLVSAMRPHAENAVQVRPRQGVAYQFDAILRPENSGGKIVKRTKDERRLWLSRNVRGASLSFVEFHDLSPLHIRKSDGHRLSATRTRAIGVACVTDAEEFDQFLARGGPGTFKAYGLGLWLLPELMLSTPAPVAEAA